MVYRFNFGLSALIAVLVSLFSSCSSDRKNEPFAADSYVTLQLDVVSSVGVEQARAMMSFSDMSNFKLKFAPVGTDVLPMKTFVYTKEGVLLFEQELPWKVEENRTRLSYSGSLEIKAQALQNVDVSALTLVVHTVSRKVYPFLIVPSLSKETEMDLPLFMSTKVHQLGNKLVLSEPATALFKPLGTMGKLVVRNEMDVPTIIEGVSFNNFPVEISISRDGEIGLVANTPNNDYESSPHFEKEVYRIYLEPHKTSEEPMYVWLPFQYTSTLPPIYLVGPAYTQLLPSKTPSKDGELVTYNAVIKPGDNSKVPFGLYVSEAGIVQPYVHLDRLGKSVPGIMPSGRTGDSSFWENEYSDSSAILGMRKYVPNAQIGDYTQFAGIYAPSTDLLYHIQQGNSRGQNYQDYIRDNTGAKRPAGLLDFSATIVNRGAWTEIVGALKIINKTHRVCTRIENPSTRTHIPYYPASSVLHVSTLPYEDSYGLDPLEEAFWEKNKDKVSKVAFLVSGDYMTDNPTYTNVGVSALRFADNFGMSLGGEAGTPNVGILGQNILFHSYTYVYVTRPTAY